VRLSVSGAGELAAAGSANPKDVESFAARGPDIPWPLSGDCAAEGHCGAITVQAQAAVLRRLASWCR